MMAVEKFWMVFRLGSSGARFQHPDEAAAMIEAERLARENPGSDFVVLEATKSFRCEVTPGSWDTLLKTAAEKAHAEGFKSFAPDLCGGAAPSLQSTSHTAPRWCGMCQCVHKPHLESD